MSKSKPAPKAADRYDAFTVRNYQTEGENRSDWVRIGVAFQNADARGFRLQLSALPLDGVIVVRLHEPKEAAE